MGRSTRQMQTRAELVELTSTEALENTAQPVSRTRAAAALGGASNERWPRCTGRSMMKERSKVLAFYHSTTKRRVHLRASNPVESAFAMAPHTVVQTKAPLSPP